MTINQEMLSSIKQDVSLYQNRGVFDWEGFCIENNIKTEETIFDDVEISGLIEKDENNNWTISVKKNDPFTRKLFTIAHELGHWFSYKYDGKTKQEIDKKGWHTDFAFARRDFDEVEIEANQIGAEILMPELAVRELFETNKDISILAGYFGVSELAMSYRIKNLKLEITYLEELI
jgi:Zn-dependent peptidase ImmA (M78 family)